MSTFDGWRGEVADRLRATVVADRLTQLADRIEEDNATLSAKLICEDLREAAALLRRTP